MSIRLLNASERLDDGAGGGGGGGVRGALEVIAEGGTTVVLDVNLSLYTLSATCNTKL
jgi:hypothetical protein